MEFIDYLIYFGDNIWSILGVCAAFFAVYKANEIAKKQIEFSDEIAKIQVKFSETQLEYYTRQMKVDSAKFVIESAKIDLGVMLNQQFFTYNGQFNENSHYKDGIAEKIIEGDLMIGIAQDKIQEGYDRYNDLIENNPMGYKTTCAETIIS